MIKAVKKSFWKLLRDMQAHFTESPEVTAEKSIDVYFCLVLCHVFFIKMALFGDL